MQDFRKSAAQTGQNFHHAVQPCRVQLEIGLKQSGVAQEIQVMQILGEFSACFHVQAAVKLVDDIERTEISIPLPAISRASIFSLA